MKKLAPAPAEGVVIDTISYGALGQVQIEGRGQGGSHARLYLNNAAVVTAPIGAKGNWGAVLTDVAAGIYTLRVDQLDDVRHRDIAVRDAVPARSARGGRGGDGPSIGTCGGTCARGGGCVRACCRPHPPRPRPHPPSRPPNPEPAAEPEPVAVKRAEVVTVQPGFTLWQIATENYGDGMLYVKVFEANKGQIRDPDLIYPGQIFAVPAASE